MVLRGKYNGICIITVLYWANTVVFSLANVGFPLSSVCFQLSPEYQEIRKNVDFLPPLGNSALREMTDASKKLSPVLVNRQVGV